MNCHKGSAYKPCCRQQPTPNLGACWCGCQHSPEVMEVGELVDAALVGFDRRELVTIPPLHVAERWTALDGASRAYVGSSPSPCGRTISAAHLVPDWT